MTAGLRTAYAVAIIFAAVGILAALVLLGRRRASVTATAIDDERVREAA